MGLPRVVFICVCFAIGAILRPAGLVGCAASDTHGDLGPCGPTVPSPDVGTYAIVDGQVSDMVGGSVEVTDTGGGYRRLTLRYSDATNAYDVVYMWPNGF
jgi:hypothetical protein